MPVYQPHVMAQITARVPRGHQGFWSLIRDISGDGRDFSIADIDALSNVHRDTVRDYVKRLVKAGYLEIVQQGTPRGLPTLYRLVKSQAEAPRLKRDGTPAAPTGLGQEQMWRSMQMLRDFTARDLAVAASTPKIAVAVETAKSYIKHLASAGYLRHVAHGIYRLRPQMMTGPLAPQVYRTNFVYDPNTGKIAAPSGADAPEAVEVRP